MTTKQYTIRGVPPVCDAVARRRARESHQSLNAVLVQALERGFDLESAPVRHADLDDLAGTWVHDAKFDRAVADMHKIDEGLWK